MIIPEDQLTNDVNLHIKRWHETLTHLHWMDQIGIWQLYQVCINILVWKQFRLPRNCCFNCCSVTTL